MCALRASAWRSPPADRIPGPISAVTGVAGLAGLDKLYSFMLVFKLQSVVNHYRARLVRRGGEGDGKKGALLCMSDSLRCAAMSPLARDHLIASAASGQILKREKRSMTEQTTRGCPSPAPTVVLPQESGAGDILAATRRALGPPVGLPEAGLQGYAEALARTSKAVVWAPLQEALTVVGQAQLLRRHIASELSGDANLDRRAGTRLARSRLRPASSPWHVTSCPQRAVLTRVRFAPLSLPERAAISWPSRWRRATRRFWRISASTTASRTRRAQKHTVSLFLLSPGARMPAAQPCARARSRARHLWVFLPAGAVSGCGLPASPGAVRAAAGDGAAEPARADLHHAGAWLLCLPGRASFILRHGEPRRRDALSSQAGA